MRNSILSVCFLCLAGYLGYAAIYDRQRIEWLLDLFVNKTYEYPDSVELVSTDGRTLKVILFERTQSHIRFEREDTRESFVYPINLLSSKSQKLIFKYPASGKLSSSIGSASSDSSDEALDEIYLEQSRIALARINQKIAELHREFNATPSMAAKRGYFREAEVLENQKNELIRKIAEREK
ncbi:MAG: hypothetical protein ACSHYA_17600 [Opitutaceae bacterium]